MWAIVTEKTIHIPGDERSRANPGHGYPAYDEKYKDFQLFTDYDVFLNEVTKLNRSYRIFKAYEIACELEIKREIIITPKK